MSDTKTCETCGRADTPASPLYPSLCRFAAWVWIVKGVMGMPWYLTAAPLRTPTLLAFGAFSFTICCLLLLVGIQTLRGKPRDMLANGVGSIILGLSDMGAAINPRVHIEAAMAAFNMCASFSLVLAGAAVLAARPDYRLWRSARSGPPRTQLATGAVIANPPEQDA